MKRSPDAIYADRILVLNALDASAQTVEMLTPKVGLTSSQVRARLSELVAAGKAATVAVIVPHLRKRGPKPVGYVRTPGGEA